MTAGLLGGADRGHGAAPEAVARAVADALSANRPKTRYRVGGGARSLLILRWLLSDRNFDAVMRFAARRMTAADVDLSKSATPR